MFLVRRVRCVRPAIRATTIAVVRRRIADIRRRIEATITVVAITNRRDRMALMIAAAMASHPDRTVLMSVEPIASLHALMDPMVAQASALIRVLAPVLLRWVETLDATVRVLLVVAVAAIRLRDRK